MPNMNSDTSMHDRKVQNDKPNGKKITATAAIKILVAY